MTRRSISPDSFPLGYQISYHPHPNKFQSTNFSQLLRKDGHISERSNLFPPKSNIKNDHNMFSPLYGPKQTDNNSANIKVDIYDRFDSNRNKFKQMSDDLSKLKKRLESIMNQNDQNMDRQLNRNVSHSMKDLNSPYFYVQYQRKFPNRSSQLMTVNQSNFNDKMRQNNSYQKNTSQGINYEFVVNNLSSNKLKSEEMAKMNNKHYPNIMQRFHEFPVQNSLKMTNNNEKLGNNSVNLQQNSVIQEYIKLQYKNKLSYDAKQQKICELKTQVEKDKFVIEPLNFGKDQIGSMPALNLNCSSNRNTQNTRNQQTNRSNQTTLRMQAKSLDKIKLIQSQKQNIQIQGKLSHVKLEKDHLQIEKLVMEGQIKKLNNKIKNCQKNYQAICQQLQLCKKRENSYLQRLTKLDQQMLQQKSKKRSSADEILKIQVEETNKIKMIIQEKNNQILKLNQTIITDSRKAQQDINQLKNQIQRLINDKKMTQNKHKTQIKNKQSQKKSLQIQLQATKTKLQLAIKQSKSKDDFLRRQLNLIEQKKQQQQKYQIIRFINDYFIEFLPNQQHQIVQEQKCQQEAKQNK